MSSNLTITDPFGTVIFITSDNVTIDLNGFTIQGPSVCHGHGSTPTTGCTVSNTNSVGIDASEHTGIKSLNGYIRGMGFVGLVCLGDAHVEGINASLDASGIQATGVIVHNILNYNLIAGFNGGGVVRENVANGNNIGFLAGLALEGVVENNIANFNAGYGFFGQTETTVVSGNSARGNGTANILVACPGSITGNSGSITVNGSSTGCVFAQPDRLSGSLQYAVTAGVSEKAFSSVSLSIAAAFLIPGLNPSLDLLEDDGVTDIQGSVANFSNASVPEPSLIGLVTSGFAALIIRKRVMG